MHRHGYKGRKFGRERDQRQALIKGLAESLIVNESIETTAEKAKELVPYAEKLITRAKKGDLASRRLVIARLHTVESAHKLFDEIAPKLTGRVSGHLRITKTRVRRGDSAQLARVSFVDDLKAATPKPATKKEDKAETARPAPKKSETTKKAKKSGAAK